jgi:hypothetical protein
MTYIHAAREWMMQQLPDSWELKTMAYLFGLLVLESALRR